MSDIPNDTIIARQLVNTTVRESNTLALNAYNSSRDSLGALAESYQSLHLTKVDIGATPNVQWSNAPQAAGGEIAAGISQYLPGELPAFTAVAKPPISVGTGPTGTPRGEPSAPTALSYTAPTVGSASLAVLTATTAPTTTAPSVSGAAPAPVAPSIDKPGVTAISVPFSDVTPSALVAPGLATPNVPAAVRAFARPEIGALESVGVTLPAVTPITLPGTSLAATALEHPDIAAPAVSTTATSLTPTTASAMTAVSIAQPDVSHDMVTALTKPAIPPLAPLPALSALAPVIDVEQLTAAFSFVETPYTERVAADIQAGIKRVLSGDMGLPQSYWAALWAEVSGDLARLQAGKLRQARNRGAASFWPLPGETVLAASRAIQDEGARAQQQARLEHAKQQATFAREDFWQAVQQGIAFEAQWIAVNQQMATRALASAEQLVNVRVQVHNANLARFNALVECARLASTLDGMAIERVIKGHGAEMAMAALELEGEKAATALPVQVYGALVAGRTLALDGQKAAADVALRTHSADLAAAGLTLDGLKAQADVALRAHGSNVAVATLLLDADKAGADVELRSHSADLAADTFDLEVSKTAVDAALRAHQAGVTAATLGLDASKATADVALRSHAADLAAAGVELDASKAAADVALRAHAADLGNATLALDGAKATADIVLRAHSADLATASLTLDSRKTAADVTLRAHRAGVDEATLALDASKAAADVVLRAQSAELAGATLDFEVSKANADAALKAHGANLAAATLTHDINKAAADIALRNDAAQLARVSAQIEAAKLEIAAYQAKWAACQIDLSTQIAAFGEEVRFWSAKVGADAQYEGLKQERNKVDVQAFTAQLGRVSAMASGTAQLLQARTGVAALQAQQSNAMSDWEVKQNQFALEVSKMTQAAQEAKARIDVAQAQWLDGQGKEILQNVAQLTAGFAQAAVAAAKVGLSSSVSYQGSDSYSTNASRNTEKVW